MARLIEDVIRIVLEIIYHSDINPPWRFLSLLSLVCKEWANHAQRLLYTSVRIETLRQLECFLKATDPSTERGRQLGEMVLILRVIVHSPGYVYRIGATRLPELLARCRALYELRLVLEDITEIDTATLEKIRRSTPPILALRIRDSMNTGNAARQLLHVWPTVRHLALRSSSIGIIPPTEDEPSPTFNLYELRWEGLHGPSVNFLLWILNHNAINHNNGHLRILHLSALPTDDKEGEIAAYFGRYLHSLRVPRGDRSLIQSAINLKELYILHDQDLTFNFVRSLPLSIEHIACTVSTGHYQAILNVLETKGEGHFLKNLRTMSLYCHSADLSPYSWDILVSQAMSVDVNIIRQEQRGFLVGGSENLVATNKFPRKINIRQFEQMSRAVHTLPIIYTTVEDELTVSVPPPRSRDPSPFRESNSSVTPYSRSVDPSRSSLGLRQPIRLDESFNVPRAWDYENDKPLERIVLDDPPSPERSRFEKWGRVRKSLDAIGRRFGSHGS
ncbi:hypothetical protein CPB86DRAFT_805553 [Serendipita vermifera]|nr:hypothetical protein CPB86DRAFT_805553 [Serendipita vermifera]